ncbi:MAG: glycosyltransferase family 4 protein [Methylococcales bacterium]
MKHAYRSLDRMDFFEDNGIRYRVAVLNSHPIQYFAPLYRYLSQDPEIDLTVFYCADWGVREIQDDGFATTLKWDVPLLDGYRYKFLPNRRKDDSVSGFFGLINPSIINELSRGKYHALIVHGHGRMINLLAIGAAKILKIPVFIRGDSNALTKRSCVKDAVRRPLIGLLYHYFCSAFLAVGKRNAEYYSSYGVPRERTFLVPHAVNNEYFIKSAAQYSGHETALREAYGLPRDKLIVLYASKLIRRKRPMDLVLAFRRLRERATNVALVFVGSGSEEQRLREYVEQHSVQDVYFLGFRNQSELPKLYAISAVFVLPSENEPYGLIVNEVMCAGLPVVATDEIGAVADLVTHGENGLLYSTGDIAALSQCLESLVGDQELRRFMGMRSLERISNWSYQQCAEGLKNALAYCVTTRDHKFVRED